MKVETFVCVRTNAASGLTEYMARDAARWVVHWVTSKEDAYRMDYVNAYARTGADGITMERALP